MSETLTVPQSTTTTPIEKVYKDAISASAHSLPPAPDYNKLPTDNDVLGRVPAEEEKKEGDDSESEVEATIVPVEVNKNEDSEKAKGEIFNEKKIEEFKLDDDNDTEFIKSLYNEGESDVAGSVEGNKEGKKVADVDLEEKYKPFKEKASEYDAVMSNPLAKAFIEFVKSGKNDPSEFAKEVGFINLETMTAHEILEQDFKNEGLTSEEIIEEMENFESKSPYEKKKRVNEIKAELAKKRDEKIKTFTAGSEQVQAIQKKAADIGMSQLNDLVPKMENKKYEGLLITPEMANRVKSYVIAYPEPIHDGKGQFVGYDIKESISTAVSKLYKNEWKKALVELGRTLGADKALTARIRPNKKVATTAVVPSQTRTFEDVAKEQSEKRWNERMGKSNIKK